MSVGRIIEHVGSSDAFEQELVVGDFTQVRAKQLEWVWLYKIPKSKLTICCGNPDVGKSTAVIDIVARYTTGRSFPDGAENTETPGHALFLIAEDDLEDTTKPRLMAAGADMSKVHYVSTARSRTGAKHSERMLALDTDVALLERTLRQNPGINLVVFDPITSYLGRANANKEQELRQILVPMRELAQRTSVTMIGIAHFNKRLDVGALQRVSGAVAMTGVPRAVWLFVKDPDVAGQYKMLLGKGNLAKRKNGLK